MDTKRKPQPKRKPRVSAADRLGKLLENAIALSADVHGSPAFHEFASKHGERWQGCIGVYSAIQQMAEALTEYEIRNRIDWGVSEDSPDWIESIEALAGAFLESGDVPNVEKIIKRIPK